MKLQTRLFIGGEFVEAERRGTIATLNPHNNSKLADVAEATEPDVDRAVAAASKAFPAWRDTAAADRGRRKDGSQGLRSQGNRSRSGGGTGHSESVLQSAVSHAGKEFADCWMTRTMGAVQSTLHNGVSIKMERGRGE